MDFYDLKSMIYEGASDGSISSEAALDLMNMIDSESSSYMEEAISEMNLAESTFIETAIDYANGDAACAYFEKKAETFGQKVSNALAKFKKWVSELWDKLLTKLGARKREEKVSVPKAAVDLLKNIDKSLIDISAKVTQFFYPNDSPSAKDIKKAKRAIDDEAWYKNLLEIVVQCGMIGWTTVTAGVDAVRISKGMVLVGVAALIGIVDAIKKSINKIISTLEQHYCDQTNTGKLIRTLHRILVWVEALPSVFSNKPVPVERVYVNPETDVFDKNGHRIIGNGKDLVVRS